MVRLLKPQAGMRVYDPCVGSGGMLILSREYVAETGGDARNLALYGQDASRYSLMLPSASYSTQYS